MHPDPAAGRGLGGHGRSDRWRWARLLDAPHRLCFAAAALLLALSALWWAGVNVAAASGFVVAWSLPRSVSHSVLMTFGFMPLFFAGFLFTAGPRWLARPPVPAARLVGPVVAQLAGWAVFVPACHGLGSGPTLGAIGLCMVAAGWLAVVVRFAALVRRSAAPDRAHALLVGVACAVGLAGLCTVASGVAQGRFWLVQASVHSCLWWFTGLVFATVVHRMVPFLSAAAAVPVLDAWQPLWLLGCLVGVFAVQGAASFAEAFGVLDGAAWRPARSALELLAGTGVVVLALRWGHVQRLRTRLVAMLHIGFTWLGMSLLMAGAARLLAPAYGATTALGLAATHAYTMGFLGSTLFSMVSRVSSGQSGRAVAADDFLWRLFWVLQATVLARLGAAALAISAPAASKVLVLAAAVGWAGVCTTWAVRYGRWYGKPGLDRRDGDAVNAPARPMRSMAAGSGRGGGSASTPR